MFIFLMFVGLTFSQALPLSGNDSIHSEQERKRQEIEEEYQRQLNAKKNEIRSDLERKKYDKNYEE